MKKPDAPRNDERTPIGHELDDHELDQVTGGFAPIIAAFATAEVWVPGVTGAFAAAGVWAANSASTLGTTISNIGNQIGNAYNAVNSYLNPSPGHGAPGDTYTPAQMNPNGENNIPSSFTAPASAPLGPPTPPASPTTPGQDTNPTNPTENQNPTDQQPVTTAADN